MHWSGGGDIGGANDLVGHFGCFGFGCCSLSSFEVQRFPSVLSVPLLYGSVTSRVHQLVCHHRCCCYFLLWPQLQVMVMAGARCVRCSANRFGHRCANTSATATATAAAAGNGNDDES